MNSKKNANCKKKILVGMSGGVDSSVAAALLVSAGGGSPARGGRGASGGEQGFDVTGGFIKNWSDAKDLWTGECEWRGERRDALRVAAKLGIPLLTFDFEKEYRDRVLDRMFLEYESGITPNPDVLCNEEIKFGLFFDAAMKLGFDGIATGHYARVRREIPLPSGGASKALPLSTGGVGGGMFGGAGGGISDGKSHLFKGVDADKDQSYFLHRISQASLSKTIFPIGHLKKSDVRLLASDFKLPTAHKPDSQGICFVGKVDFHDFLRKKIEPKPGEIVTPEGEVIGRHDGLDAYTIGQRHGLHVSKEGKTWYVAGKDRGTNRLIVVPDREHPLLYRDTIALRDIRWIAGPPPDPRIEVAVRYRSEMISGDLAPPLVFSSSERRRHLDIPSFRRRGGHGSGRGGAITILLREPAWAPAPGQSAVIYQGDECLGGGFLIEEGIDSHKREL